MLARDFDYGSEFAHYSRSLLKLRWASAKGDSQSATHHSDINPTRPRLVWQAGHENGECRTMSAAPGMQTVNEHLKRPIGRRWKLAK